MGRADQRTKVKGMFVDPKQIATLVGMHDGIDNARLVVGRDGDRDTMTLHVRMVAGAKVNLAVVTDTLQEITKLKGDVQFVDSLPNDGMVISDERDYES